MFELWSYNHDGYERESHIKVNDFADGVEKAVRLAARGDGNYYIRVRLKLDGVSVLEVDQAGAKELLKNLEC